MLPGGNKAFLTLADGRKISLTDAAEGKLASQAGVTLTQTEGGQLMYQTGTGTQPTGPEHENPEPTARKSVVEGKRESVRVDLGGRRTMKKTTRAISHERHIQRETKIHKYIQQPTLLHD